MTKPARMMAAMVAIYALGWMVLIWTMAGGA